MTSFAKRVTRAAASCALLFAGVSSAGVPAFPGAEGFGAVASGGRGGSVFIVRNLCDYRPNMVTLDPPAWNAGSPPDAFDCDSSRDLPEETLRWGLEQVQGPRTIVFAVGGTIYLREALWIADDNITIAGQSSPVPGITLANHYVTAGGTAGSSDNSHASLYIDGSNIIIRHIRIRPGPDCELALTTPPLARLPNGLVSITDSECAACTCGGTGEPVCASNDPCSLCGTSRQRPDFSAPHYFECTGTNHDSLVFYENADTVIVDHVSLSWATDQVASSWWGDDHVWVDGSVPRDITLQNSIISQGLIQSTNYLGAHSTATLFQGGDRISFHHNFLGYNLTRSPKLLLHGEVEAVSNTIYGFGFWAAEIDSRRDNATGTQMHTRLDFIHNYYNRGSWWTGATDYSPFVNQSRFSRNFDAVTEWNPGFILSLRPLAGLTPLMPGEVAYSLHSSDNEFINPTGWGQIPRFTPDDSDTEVDVPFCYNVSSGGSPLGSYSTTEPWCPDWVTTTAEPAVQRLAGTRAVDVASQAYPVTLTPTSSLAAHLGSETGATLPARDAVDQQLVDAAVSGGAFIKYPAQGTGAFVDQPPMLFCSTTPCTTPDLWWPGPELTPAFVDADADGMADAWELEHEVDDPNGDGDNDVHTNLEEFLNGTDPGVCEVNGVPHAAACGVVGVPASDLWMWTVLCGVILLATTLVVREPESGWRAGRWRGPSR